MNEQGYTPTEHRVGGLTARVAWSRLARTGALVVALAVSGGCGDAGTAPDETPTENVTGTAPQRVWSGSGVASNPVVDGGYLYWLGSNKLFRRPTSGGAVEDLATIDNLPAYPDRRMVVSNGVVFFSVTSAVTRVRQVNGRWTVGTVVERPVGTCEFAVWNGTVYFTDGDRTVWRAPVADGRASSVTTWDAPDVGPIVAGPSGIFWYQSVDPSLGDRIASGLADISNAVFTVLYLSEGNGRVVDGLSDRPSGLAGLPLDYGTLTRRRIFAREPRHDTSDVYLRPLASLDDAAYFVVRDPQGTSIVRVTSPFTDNESAARLGSVDGLERLEYLRTVAPAGDPSHVFYVGSAGHGDQVFAVDLTAGTTSPVNVEVPSGFAGNGHTYSSLAVDNEYFYFAVTDDTDGPSSSEIYRVRRPR